MSNTEPAAQKPRPKLTVVPQDREAAYAFLVDLAREITEGGLKSDEIATLLNALPEDERPAFETAFADVEKLKAALRREFL